MGNFFNFNTCKGSLDFASDIQNGKISLKDSKNKQYKKFDYNLTDSEKIKSKTETINAAEKLYENRNKTVADFENGVLPLNHKLQKEKQNMSDKVLPNWVKVSKKRCMRYKIKFKMLKKNNLQSRPPVTVFNFIESNELIQGIADGRITFEEALN